MSTFELFLWVAYPWLALAAFVVGLVWRWRYDQFGWTSHSSQIYESRLLRITSPLFHWGIIFVFVGHVMGLAFPKSFTRAIGISDAAYHLIATIPGTIAAAMVIIGLLGLLYRRVVKRSVFLATSPSDKVMYVLLSLAILSGAVATISLQVFGGPHGYDYRETISPWIRQLMIFNPQPELMADVPWQFKVHVVAGLTLIACWPFTRLVHAFSVPLGYLTRPYVVYRSRDIRTQPMQRNVAWEPVRSNKAQLDNEAKWSGA
ncbi:nitrate reductase [Corynebacterium atypicum]|uniref:Nitrate reductase n=1 Tax=Corynebacterium atypicum TaxID=191610 RepID=A0ABM5QNA3_9CORY|nr:respiratory nitrate reductase subunit gamma [Corynebacterium atypicum]AIG64326.1 nitrate reductase [Corynebacterium atypicum]